MLEERPLLEGPEGENMALLLLLLPTILGRDSFIVPCVFVELPFV